MQAAIHHDAATAAMQPTGADLDIHGSYYFFPWHRAYLYFHERILAWHLTGEKSLDPNFRLFAWDWESDTPGADKRLPIPKMFTQAPLNVDRLGYRPFTDANDVSLTDMPWDASFFYGEAPKSATGNAGAIAGTPHGVVHNMTGGQMTDMTQSSNDPIFFAHHANVDKVWAWWRRLPGTADPSYIQQPQWYFTDWDGTCVVVRPNDVTDHEGTLKYSYAAPTFTINGPKGTTLPVPVSPSGGLLMSAVIASQMRAATNRRVGVVLNDVPVDRDGGTFDVFTTGPQGRFDKLGSFTVFDHVPSGKATAFILTTPANAARLRGDIFVQRRRPAGNNTFLAMPPIRARVSRARIVF